MNRIVLAHAILLFTLIPAAAERIISVISTDTVQITASFAGERMTFYGTIAPDAGAEQRYVEGPYHAIVVVMGPPQDRVARKKTRSFGIWLNTEQVEFRGFPSFFHVLSSGRLDDFTDVNTLTTKFILPESHAASPDRPISWQPLIFGRELIRLMSKEGLFGVQESGVNFHSDIFYSAQLILPSNAPPGAYIAQTYLFRDGQIIARKSDGFAVRKIGFERFLTLASTQSPLLYGFACVVLALFTGWLGGVLFRR